MSISARCMGTSQAPWLEGPCQPTGEGGKPQPTKVRGHQPKHCLQHLGIYLQLPLSILVKCKGQNPKILFHTELPILCVWAQNTWSLISCKTAIQGQSGTHILHSTLMLCGVCPPTRRDFNPQSPNLNRIKPSTWEQYKEEEQIYILNKVIGCYWVALKFHFRNHVT